MARAYRYEFANELPEGHPLRISPYTLLPFPSFYIYSASEEEARQELKEVTTVRKPQFNNELRVWEDATVAEGNGEMTLINRVRW